MSAAALPDIERVRDALRSVVDPEAGINIVELGLVYDIRHADGVVAVDMTMTSPACPMGEMIMDDARAAIAPLLPDVDVIDDLSETLDSEPRFAKLAGGGQSGEQHIAFDVDTDG